MGRNCCVYSSFIFLLNAIVAYYYNYFIYSYLFVLLFGSSIIYHLNYNIYTYIIDKTSVISVVSYGGYLFFYKIFERKTELNNIVITYSSLVVLTFLSIIYLYYYGYCYNKYCFNEDINSSQIYHSLLHVFASIGHFFITIL